MIAMSTSIFRRITLAGVAATWLVTATLPAAALGLPRDKPVLTVQGKIGVKNQGAQAVWDLAMLEALPQQTFTTLTPWENRPIRFSGPLLRDVLAAVKASGANIRATALNDYRIDIPMSDTEQFDVIMATRMNGQHMPVRAKGPLFIVYPFDSRPELKHSTYYERSIWQLKSLDIE